MMKIGIIVILTVVFFLGTACKKVEGQGGTSTISGRIYVEEYDAFGAIVQEYYAADERVFILYGTDDDIYDDDFRTSFDGSFQFDFLTKGNYRIFAYEDCATCPSGEAPVIKEVVINENKSTIVLPDIVIRK